MNLEISIGILAHNEETSLPATLASLFQQSIFKEMIEHTHIEIVIVANGCTDNTVPVAEETLKNLVNEGLQKTVTHKVIDLEKGGKSNAWNHYVHLASKQSSDYLFLMDADIEILEPTTLASMINLLESREDVWISVDRPVKDVLLKEDKTLTENLSAMVSGISGGNRIEEEPAWICGQLYCARGAILRQLWLPTLLPVEDSFVYTMLTTNGLSEAVRPERVILAPPASHSFEAYTNISRLFRHERWLMVSSVVNDFVYQLISSEEASLAQTSERVKSLNDTDEKWVHDAVQDGIEQAGWWLIPKFILIRRFYSLKNKSFFKAMLLFPLSVSAFLVDLMLAIQANFELHRGSKLGYWGK